MKRAIPSDVLEMINKNQRFLLITHRKPDGDAVGSTIALGKILKQRGKEVEYYLDLPLEERLDFFEESNFFNKLSGKAPDVYISLDCSTLDYAHKPPNFDDKLPILVIDHHISNSGYGDANDIRHLSATGELIEGYLSELGVEPDEEILDALYTAISTDTGSFQFSNVGANTHYSVAHLYEKKPDFSHLAKRLHLVKSYNQMKLLGEAIHSLELEEEGHIAYVLLGYETIQTYGGYVNITDDIANIGSNVRGCVLAVTLKEKEPGWYKVSLRTGSNSGLNVAEFAEKHGGGGHLQAAGFDYRDAIEDLKKEVYAFYQTRSLNEK